MSSQPENTDQPTDEDIDLVVMIVVLSPNLMQAFHSTSGLCAAFENLSIIKDLGFHMPTLFQRHIEDILPLATQLKDKLLDFGDLVRQHKHRMLENAGGN